MKQYKAILFDWDGTAVVSRRAPADDVIAIMKKLLRQKIYLVIISGTTYENIAGGNLEKNFTPQELAYLFLGLGRGAYNYRFDESGAPLIFQNEIPSKEEVLKIHKACFELHTKLLIEYDWNTDIVFSRPNYCKIDLMVEKDRGEQLFLQEGEAEQLKEKMRQKGFEGGLQSLLKLGEEIGKENGLLLKATTDAKFLELGVSSKSNNVEHILDYLEKNAGIKANDCSFWGDEYLGVDKGVFGSDSYMLTDRSEAGDFFDVSTTIGERPQKVKAVGGGVETFLSFLKEQAKMVHN